MRESFKFAVLSFKRRLPMRKLRLLKTSNLTPDSSPAFSLVEVVLALGVASFALLAIIGMLPIGANTQQDSMRETIAANIGTAIINDLNQADTVSALYQIDLNQGRTECYLTESGILTTAPKASDYKAVINLARSGNLTQGSATISWPATAPKPPGSITLFISLDHD
jgi:uncharacterized protein (TIGR02598 family)